MLGNFVEQKQRYSLIIPKGFGVRENYFRRNYVKNIYDMSGNVVQKAANVPGFQRSSTYDDLIYLHERQQTNIVNSGKNSPIATFNSGANLTATNNNNISPEGTMTATTYMLNGTASNGNWIGGGGNFVNAGATDPFSFAVDVAPVGGIDSANRYFTLALRENGGFSNRIGVTIDFQTGTVQKYQNGTATVGSARVIALANGFYRIIAENCMSGNAALTTFINESGRAASASTGINGDQVGNGTTGYAVCNWMWVNDSFISSLIYTTSSTDETRLSDLNMVRVAEPNRTNSIKNSTMDGSTSSSQPTGWTSTGTTTGVTASVVGKGTTQINIEGTLRNFTYLDYRLLGTSSGISGHSIWYSAITDIAATNSQNWALSVYAAIVGGSINGLTTIRQSANQYNSSSGSLSNITGSNILSVIGSTFNRYIDVLTTNNASTAYFRPRLEFAWANGAAIDITIRIFAPQMELGSDASEFIPTTNAAVTRSYTAKELFNASEGTIVFDCVPISLRASDRLFCLSDYTNNDNNISVLLDSGNIKYHVRNGASTIVDIGSLAWVAGTRYRIAIRYKQNDFAMYINGANAVTDTSGNVPTGLCNLMIGAAGDAANIANMEVAYCIYLPYAALNDELQVLSSF